jgi:glycosyltransferase involved in cell wall biosynthesis
VFIGKHLGIPAVVSFLGGETAFLPKIRYGNMSRPSTKLMTLWVAKHSDALVTLTHHQLNELQKCGYEPRCRDVIPFGADRKVFTATAKDISIRPIRFLHVANLYAVKDQPTLLRAFRRITESVDAHLRIIGEDQSSGMIHKLANEMGIQQRVEFLGHTPHRNLPQHYEWAHVLLHTSLHEAQGVVVAEAAASGVLVAGTRTGLLADFGEKMAVLSKPGDHETLAAQILKILSDPRRYEAIRHAALDWACEHDADWTLHEHMTLYEETLKRRRNSEPQA